MRTFEIIGCLILLSVASAPVVGQETREMTVEEAVGLGLELNPSVMAAEAEAAGAAAAYREVRAEGLPALRTQASYTRLGGSIPEAEVTLPGFDSTFTLLPIELNRYNSEISVEQPLFTGGRIRGQSRAASHEAAAADRVAQQRRVDVAFEIRRSFWSLFGALARLEATETSIAYIDEYVAEVEDRLEEGEVLLSEVLAGRTRRSEILLDRLDASNAVRAAQLTLARLTGLPLDTEIVPLTQPVVVADGTEIISDGVVFGGGQDTPAVTALEQQVLALQASLAAVQATWIPELSVVGRYIYARPNPYAFTDQSEFRGTWEAGVSFRWSAWEGGARSARVAQARENLRAAEARLQDARDQAAVDAAMQTLELERAAEAVAVAEQNLVQAEEAFRVTGDLFAEGMVLPSAVLEAEEAYRSAQARRSNAVAEYEIARAAVTRARGEL